MIRQTLCGSKRAYTHPNQLWTKIRGKNVRRQTDAFGGKRQISANRNIRFMVHNNSHLTIMMTWLTRIMMASMRLYKYHRVHCKFDRHLATIYHTKDVSPKASERINGQVKA